MASALGNLSTDSPDAIAALIEALGDEDSDVRRSAASALGNLGGGSAEIIDILLEKLDDEENSGVADAIFEAVYSLVGSAEAGSGSEGARSEGAGDEE